MNFSRGEAAFLRRHGQCALATMLGGFPHVVPVSYLFFEGSVWIRIQGGSRKHRNLLADSRLAIVAYTHHPDRGVLLRGHAQFVSGGAEFARMCRRYYRLHRRTAQDSPFIKVVPVSKASWSDRRDVRGGRVFWRHSRL